MSTSSRRLTEAERSDIEAAIRAGRPRNEIARDFGRSGRTISNVATEAGLTFDRRPTWRATAARRADLAERRSKLSERLLLDAERLLEQLWTPSRVHSFTAKGGFQECELPEPTPREKRELMTAAAIAIDKSILLDSQRDPEGELSAFDAWLEHQLGSAPTESESRDEVIERIKAESNA